MAEAFTLQEATIATLITILVESIFIWLAARFVLDRSSILAALATAILGSFLAVLVFQLVDGGALGIGLAIATWALLASLFFRTNWIKGAIIGLVAWVLWALVVLAVRAVNQA